MADNNVDILLNVDLDASDTLKTIASLRMQTADLREEQKQLDRTTADGAAEYERLNVQIKANNKTIQQYEKQIVNTMTQEKAQEGSIKSMRAELSNAKAEYAEMSKAEREGAKGREVLDKAAALNAELKELESAYGDNQRKVGEYENAGKALAAQIGELTEKMMQMKVAGQETSPEYKKMHDEAVRLKAAQDEVNQSIGNAAKGTASLDAVAQGVQSITSAYATWKMTTSALGIENKEMDDIIQKLIVAMGALQALTSLQNLAQKQSNIYRAASNILQKLGIKQTQTEVTAVTANAAAITAEATAENASTAAKVKGAIASKAATAAQWLWNAAISANPVMILVVATLALIAGITLLVGALNKESEAAKESKRAQEDLNMTLEVGERIRDRIARKRTKDVNERLIKGREEIQAMKKNGATEAEIQKTQAKIDTDVANLKIRNSKLLIAQKEHELEKIDASIAAMRNEQIYGRLSSEKYDELTKKINENRDAREALVASIDDENAAIGNLYLDNIDREAEQKKREKDAVKTAADAAKTRVDAAIAAYEKQLERQKAFKEATLKAEAGFQGEDLRTRQKYAQQLFALEQSTEKARLDTLRKYKRITETEYAETLAIMSEKQKEFSNAQTKELNAYFDSERKAIVGMLTQTLDEQVKGVEKQYTETLKRLENIKPPTMIPGEDPETFAKRLAEFEEFALEQTKIVIRLEEQRDKQIEELRKSALATQIQLIENSTKEVYKDDLSKYQNNERMKLETTENMLREQIAAKKAAGLTTYDEEAQLQQLGLQRTALNLNRDLLLAGNNAKAKYDAKVKALTDERKLHEGNADKQLEIDQRIADAEKELIDARLEKFSEWADAASELMAGFDALMTSGLDRQKQKVQETYDNEAAALADKYALGLLTEAEYNRDSMKLEKQKAKDEAKIERERAIRERASKVFSVITDTSMGIVKAVAASPLTGGLPWSAIVAATGALNLATILSEPLPKAARGGLIQGPLHSQGGAIIEAEGGEAIMSRRAVSMFGPILSALNVLGGGVPFAEPLSDGGYMLRSHDTGGATAEEIAAALEGVRIVTFVEDINKGQQNYAEIESAGAV